MDFAIYEKTGHAKYAKLATTVAAIAEVIIHSLGSVRVQQVQHRAKTPGSLAKKILNRGGALTDDIERHAKDIAGCRIIFYTNDDVQAFVTSGVISDNFEVDWDRTKFHYPQDDADEALFISYNYVVKLKDQRTGLAEYSDLTGLWCEIQVQSTLDHAWSEMHHDTGYKPPAGGFGSAALAGVKTRMVKIMQEYLLPAGYDFQKVSDDIRRLERARAIHDSKPLDRAFEADDNNQRHDLIKLFGDWVLPYLDDLDAEAVTIRAALTHAVSAARSAPMTPKVYGEMEIRGHDFDDVADAALEIVDALRYRGEGSIAATWDFMCAVDDLTATDVGRRRLGTSIKALAGQNLHVWKMVGPWAQCEVAALLPDSLKAGRRRLAAAAAEALLSSEISGTTDSFDAVTFHQGAVRPSDALMSARRTAISALETVIVETNGDERQAAFAAVTSATKFPYTANYGPDLIRMINQDALRVVEIAGRLAPTVDLAFRARIERDMFEIYRQCCGIAHPDQADANLLVLRDQLLAALKGFGERVNNDSAYIAHKVLVGFDNVTLADWSRGTLNFEARQTERETAVNALVEACVIDAYDDWAPDILAAAAIVSDDGATFLAFDRFLEALGRERPDFARRLIIQHDVALSHFLSPVLKGLLRGPLHDDGAIIISNWIDGARHLGQILHATYASDADFGLFSRAAAAVLEGEPPQPIVLLVEVASRAAKTRSEVIGAILLPSIECCARAHGAVWVNATWFVWTDDFAAQFSDAQVDTLLALMTEIPKVGSHEEWILAAIAANQPEKVLNVFDRRMTLQRQAVAGGKLEVVPFSLHRLDKALAPHGQAIVNHVRGWYGIDKLLFEYSGGRFIKGIFPDLGLIEPLLKPFARGSDDDQDFLIQILRAYDGSPSIDTLSRDLVAASIEDSQAWKGVAIALEATGVVSGEFGFVEAYSGKKAALQAWLDDPRLPVRQFAEAHVRSFDRQIAAERRRSVEGFNLRKRRYGDD
jgi:ppGpp synthetase/RelA/SpoT-type nucleotidyltranferase